ncbi:MAG: DUF721 domain-containing protein [Candidatus Omnitrophota bacterium]
MRKGKPEAIGNLLQGIVENISQVKKNDINTIAEEWKNITGKEMFAHTKPVSFKQGNLLVNVDESAWLYQVSFMKQDLLSALEKKLGLNKVKNIHFRIGKIS